MQFYSTKTKVCPLSGSSFLTSLPFPVDLLSDVSNLNQSLQGPATTVCHVHCKVQEFCDKCRLLKNHLRQANYYHCKELSSSLIESGDKKCDAVPTATFIAVLDDNAARIRRTIQRLQKDFVITTTCCISPSGGD